MELYMSLKLFKEHANLSDLLQEAVIAATGYKAPRHAKTYVEPFIGKKMTHTLARDVGDLKAGTKVSIHSSREEGGKYYATVSGNTKKKVEIPHSHMHKPESVVVRRGSAGFEAENKLADKLKTRGLMDRDVKTAGSTGGVDFHIIHKKRGIKYGGKESNQIGGESKISLRAKMGAIALSHTPDKGWHVSQKSKIAKPNLAKAIESATVNKKPLLQHLNEHWGNPAGGKHLPNVTTDTSDLHPIHAYMKDHHADVLHIHTHGTFRGGMSEKRDRTGANLPLPKGTGRFTIGRERAGGTVNGAFRVHHAGFEKSHVDLMNDEHLEKVAKKLGH
jgi:hypothetical protein